MIWYSLNPRWDVIYRWLWLNSVSHKTQRYERRKEYIRRSEDIKKWEGCERVPEGRLFKPHYTHMKVSNVIKAMKTEQKCWEEISSSVTDRFLYILWSRGAVCSARISYHLVWRATKRKEPVWFGGLLTNHSQRSIRHLVLGFFLITQWFIGRDYLNIHGISFPILSLLILFFLKDYDIIMSFPPSLVSSQPFNIFLFVSFQNHRIFIQLLLLHIDDDT